MKKVPNDQKYLYLRTKHYKIYNEDMEGIYDFIKKISKEEFGQKSKNSEKIYGDIISYLFNGQVKEYNKIRKIIVRNLEFLET